MGRAVSAVAAVVALGGCAPGGAPRAEMSGATARRPLLVPAYESASGDLETAARARVVCAYVDALATVWTDVAVAGDNALERCDLVAKTVCPGKPGDVVRACSTDPLPLAPLVSRDAFVLRHERTDEATDYRVVSDGRACSASAHALAQADAERDAATKRAWLEGQTSQYENHVRVADDALPAIERRLAEARAKLARLRDGDPERERLVARIVLEEIELARQKAQRDSSARLLEKLHAERSASPPPRVTASCSRAGGA